MVTAGWGKRGLQKYDGPRPELVGHYTRPRHGSHCRQGLGKGCQDLVADHQLVPKVGTEVQGLTLPTEAISPGSQDKLH